MFKITQARQASKSKSICVRVLTAALAFFICLTFANTAAAQQTFTVDNNSDTAGQSACTAAANDCNLRGAITAARNAAGNDTILFEAGITNITTSAELYLDSVGGSVTINGPGANVLTIDGGAGTNLIFRANGAVFNLNGVTLTGGNANGAGGNGGAINVFGGTVTFNGVHFLNNSSAVDGGGIYIDTGANHRIENSTFSGNTATRNGGGIYVQNTNLTVVNSTVSGNSASNVGGGITGGTVTLTLRSVIITDNSAPSGGGVQYSTTTLDFGNSIIAGNTATSGNYPEIFYFSGTTTSQGNNLVGDSAGDSTNTFSAITYQSTDIQNTPPLLDPLANYGGTTPTRRLRAGSPAIDKASATAGIPTDQRGFIRPVNDPTITDAAGGDGSDIGAFEADRYLTVNTAANTFDGTCNAADCSLRDAVSVAGADAQPDTIIFNIPANSAGCSGTACTITVTSQLIPAADAGNLTTIDGGAASANMITLKNNGISETLGITAGVKVSVNNLIFTGSSGGGGAINISGTGSLLTLTNSALFDNTNTGEGGAIRCDTGCTLNMTNVTVSGNSASLGGGIRNFGTTSATNCTITNNTASGFAGGGVFNTGTFNVRNTIIAGNVNASSPDVYNAFVSQGNNLIGNGSGSSGFTNGVNGDQVGTTGAVIDPRLSPLGNYGGKTLTHALLDVAIAPNMTVSPAINAGTSIGAPLTDARGASRVGNTDIGAFEVNSVYRAALPDGKLLTFYDQTIAPESFSFLYTLTPASGTPPTGTALMTAVPPLLGETSKPDYQNIAPAAGRVSIQGTPTLAGTYPFSVMMANLVNSTTINYSISVPAAVSAAGVSISGRVLTADGRGLSNARVILLDASGNSRYAITGAFGYYSFEYISAGQTIILNVASKRFQFAPQILNANENLSEVNFTAQQ